MNTSKIEIFNKVDQRFNVYIPYEKGFHGTCFLIIINTSFAIEDPYESAIDRAESAKWPKTS